MIINTHIHMWAFLSLLFAGSCIFASLSYFSHSISSYCLLICYIWWYNHLFATFILMRLWFQYLWLKFQSFIGQEDAQEARSTFTDNTNWDWSCWGDRILSDMGFGLILLLILYIIWDVNYFIRCVFTVALGRLFQRKRKINETTTIYGSIQAQ